jgi:hypothetical protein
MTKPGDAPLRRELLDWNLLYLFSFDIELDLNRQEKLGRFPQGVRLNLFAKDGLSRVYNVGRQTSVPGGSPAISGRVEWGGDEALLRFDDVGTCNIRLAIHTDDQELIHLEYRLQGYLGPGGVERVVSAEGDDRFGTEDRPYEIPIITSPRFRTTGTRYSWLNELQAIGFGRVQAVRSKFRRNTQDVYALQ